MRYVTPLIVVLATGSTPMAAGSQQIPPPMVDAVRLLQATQAGVPMVWEIPMTRASALPRWDLDVTAPPLSMTDATQLARTWLAQRNPQVERLFMQQVTLSRVGVGFWYYTLFFVAPAQPGAPRLLYAVVLPDGSTVEPTFTLGK